LALHDALPISSWLRLRGGLVSGRGTARGLHRPLPEHPPTTREDPLEPADRPGEGEPVLGPYDPVRGVLREARASDVRSVPSHARDEAAAVRLDRPGPGDDLRRAAQGAPDLLDDGRDRQSTRL